MVAKYSCRILGRGIVAFRAYVCEGDLFRIFDIAYVTTKQIYVLDTKKRKRQDFFILVLN